MSKFLVLFKIQLNELLLLFLGAIPGALIRWKVDNDFIVNLIGAAILGLLYGLEKNSRIYIILGIGFCGAMTTFSTWILNGLDLAIKGNLIGSFYHLFGTLIFGIISAGLGFFAGSLVKLLRLFR